MDKNGMSKILIVDDEVHLLRMLHRALEKDGLEIITATTIEEAEYALQNTVFDLILADIRLTGVLSREGLELIDYAKEFSPATKIIIMTGYGSPEIEREAYQKGAFYYFEKPIDLMVLKAKIREIKIFEKYFSKE
jgi:DNA-binding NtrC family response regulator